MSVLKSLALLLTLASAAATATASDFFVDGLRGTDWPDYGRSASQPWKTIQYAAQHLPVPMPTQSHTLFIAGGQTYGAATNGEAFPLPALYNIQYLGTGPRPIMDVPSGTVGMWFPGTVEFTGWTKVAHLEFRNGGLKLGAGNGVRFHRPVIDDCVFDRCGVLVETPLTQSVNAPVVQSCAFRGAGAGIFLHTREHGTDFSVDATVTDCVFEDIPGDAVRLRQSDPRGTTYLMVSLNECRFTRCFVGVELSMDVGTTGPTNRFGAQLRNCAF